MNVLITADLHLDAWMREGRDPFASVAPIIRHLDALIIAGDLASNPMYQWPRALARIGRLIDPGRVWIIPGNHDYYNCHLDGDAALHDLVTQVGMSFAQKRIVDIGTTRFLCCTLWTDFALAGDRDAAMQRARMTMSDYTRIRKNGRLASGPIHPEDTMAVHNDHLQWLSQAIAEPWHGQRIIVTHHAPCAAAAAPLNGLSAAFASDLEGWISAHQPHGWFFGHTHRQFATEIHGVPVTNVSIGYPDDVADGREAEQLLRGLVSTGA